jgi:hypothetical protein
MISTSRTLSLTIPIDTLKNYLEPVLYTLKKISPRDEIVSLEIADLPWGTGQDIPLTLTVRRTKEVALTAIEDGKS